VATGGVALLLTAGFVRFSFEGLGEAIVRGGLGNLEVAPAAAGSGPAEEQAALPTFAAWEPVRVRLEAEPHVSAAMGVIRTTGLVTRGERSMAALVLAVEPERERRMRFDVHLRGGANLPDAAPDAGQDACLLGQGLARALDAKPGDSVTLLAMTEDESLNALDLSVRGIVTTGLQDLDARFVKVHRATASRLLSTSRVSALIVGLDDDAQSAEVESSLRGALRESDPALGVRDWKTRAPFYAQVRSLYLGIFGFVGGIVFVLVCLSASNMLLMTVLERTRELGTLRALGTSAGQLAGLVLLEALWLGLLGGALGGIAGAGLAAVINAAGVRMPPPPGAANPLELQLLLRPADFGAVILLMISVLTLAAVVPCWRVGRMRIVEALGHV
jgi:putative ABC transport system permease protein